MRTKSIIVGLVAINMAAVAVVLASRGRDDDRAFQEQMIAKAGEQGEVLKEWLNARQYDLGQLATSGAELAANNCLAYPDGGRRVAWSELNVQQAVDLESAIAGLASAFEESTPEALLAYMAERGEVLKPDVSKVMTKILVDEVGFKPEDLAGQSPEQVFSTFWRAAGSGARWAAYLPQYSCCTLWSTNGMPAGHVRDGRTVAVQDVARWGKRQVVNHNFMPAAGRTLEEALQGRSDALMADVKLTIQHRNAGIHGLAPHYVRFWFNESVGQWQPLMLVTIRVSNEIPARVLF